MLTRKTCKKRTRELNRKNFPSEAWFERLLFEHQVGGYRRNPSLIGKYFGDFVWFSHGIVVEIDGSSHIGKEDYDKKRDTELKESGFKICRIKTGDSHHATRVILRLKEVLGVVGSFRTPPIVRRRFSKKKRSKKIKRPKGLGKRVAKCFTDNNSKILADYNKRKALWIHPRQRKKTMV